MPENRIYLREEETRSGYFLFDDDLTTIIKHASPRAAAMTTRGPNYTTGSILV
jgi:hypothetical protein